MNEIVEIDEEESKEALAPDASNEEEVVDERSADTEESEIIDEKPEQEGSEEADPNVEENGSADFSEAQQKHLDRIIDKTIAKERIKREEIEFQLNQEREQKEGLQKYFDDDRARQEKLSQALSSDDMIDENLRNLAKSPDIPPQQQVSKIRDFRRVGDQEFNLDGTELTYKLMDEYADRGALKGQKLGLMVSSGILPKDIISLAARHDNGAKIIGGLIDNEDIRNALTVAMYESQSFDEFSLKFNNITDKLNVKSPIRDKLGSKKRLEPRDPLRPKSRGEVVNEDIIFID